MHAIALQVLRQGILEKLRDGRKVRMLDYGCGYGYSTLSFALMANSLIKHDKLGGLIQVVGVDLYADFVEKSIMNYQRYKQHMSSDKVSVDF